MDLLAWAMLLVLSRARSPCPALNLAMVPEAILVQAHIKPCPLAMALAMLLETLQALWQRLATVLALATQAPLAEAHSTTILLPSPTQVAIAQTLACTWASNISRG